MPLACHYGSQLEVDCKMNYTDVEPRGEILHYDAVELHCHGMGLVQVLVVGAPSLAQCVKRFLCDYEGAKKCGNTYTENLNVT